MFLFIISTPGASPGHVNQPRYQPTISQGKAAAQRSWAAGGGRPYMGRAWSAGSSRFSGFWLCGVLAEDARENLVHILELAGQVEGSFQLLLWNPDGDVFVAEDFLAEV